MSGTITATVKESVAKDPVPWWLFGCAGMVATTLTVGAAANLTRSGASMLYWKPHGMLPPTSESEWRREFQVYQDFCDHHQRKQMVRVGLHVFDMVHYVWWNADASRCV